MLTVTLHACVCVHARMSTPAPVRLRLSELPSLQISYLFFFAVPPPASFFFNWQSSCILSYLCKIDFT